MFNDLNASGDGWTVALVRKDPGAVVREVHFGFFLDYEDAQAALESGLVTVRDDERLVLRGVRAFPTGN